MTKPIVLTGGPLDRRIRVELAVTVDVHIERELDATRRALRSRALTRLFLLVVAGKQGTMDLAAASGKSKYAVSLQLRDLRRAGLVRGLPRASGDLRRRAVVPSWDRFAEIFRQDVAFEIELYRNRLLCEALAQVEGHSRRPELALLGSGRLGLVRRIVPDDARISQAHADSVRGRLVRLSSEFVGLFEAYLGARAYPTLREYLQGLYKELDANHRRLPARSELCAFFRFLDASFSRMEPLEVLWRRGVKRATVEGEASRESARVEVDEILLFEEAGMADPAGRYLLYPDAQKVIRPGTSLRVFPSFTFEPG